MDRIDLFKIFTRVVDCASFIRAADTLGMPRSSVSAAVQELERRVGARLINRTTRRVTPTQEGLVFHARCQRLIADVEDIEDIFRSADAGPSGLLRVDVPSRIGRRIIAPALPEFFSLYPDIKLSLGVTDRTVKLVEEQIDCVLRVGPLENSAFVGRTIGHLPLINVASPAYLAKFGVPAAPSQLNAHQIIRYASPSTGRIEAWEWVDDGKIFTRATQGSVIVNNAEASIACCLAGLGLIQVPAYDVQDHLEAGDLMEVMPDFRATPMAMTLLYPHRQHITARLTAFTNWLEALMKRHIQP